MVAVFQPGDLVEVETYNEGRHVARKVVTERWRGIVIIASPVGDGWYVVRKPSKNVRRWKMKTRGWAHTIHADEMTLVGHLEADEPKPERPTDRSKQ